MEQNLNRDIFDCLYRKSGQPVALARMTSVVPGHYGQVGLVVTLAPIHQTRARNAHPVRMDETSILIRDVS